MEYNEDGTDPADSAPPPGSPILESLLENERNRRHLGARLDAVGDRVDTDLLGDIVRHGPVLEALLKEPLDRREIEARLDVSRATSHRYTQWLDEQEFVREGRRPVSVDLAWRSRRRGGPPVRSERADRTQNAPLLDAVCEDHQDFILEPFVDATITVAEPDDPYRPVERFVSLIDESKSFRGFNTTHMVPPVLGEFHQQLFDRTDIEIIYLPHIVEKLVETYPRQAADAVERGHLTVRTREDLPYGLALFEDRVGIGGYDEVTGLMRVFVDTDSPIAREWAERVYASVRADSDSVDEWSHSDR